MGAGRASRPAPARVASRNRVILPPLREDLVDQGNQVPAPLVVRGEDGRQEGAQRTARGVAELLAELLVALEILFRRPPDPAARGDHRLEARKECQLPLVGEGRYQVVEAR